MRRLTLGLVAASSFLTVNAWSIPCDGVTVCERPSSNAASESGWGASASGVNGLKSLVSVGPTGNQVGSRYYFAAVSTDLGAVVANGGITNSGDGFTQIGSFTQNVQSTPGSTVAGGVIQSLRGSQAYYFYAQACPFSSTVNGAGCSSWSQVRNGTFSTSPYPTTVFAAPVPAADSTVDTLTVRTSVPAADQGQVSLIDIILDDLDNTLSTPILMGYINGTSNYSLTDSDYGPGFRPNTRYRYRGFVKYPYGVDVPTAARQIVGPLYTVPNVPGVYGTDGVLGRTHVTATVRFHNSASGVAFANPAGTQYEVRFVPSSGPTVTVTPAATSTGSAAEQFTVLGVGLQDGMFYTAQVRALNQGRASGWQNSAWVTLGTFTTVPWGLTLTINAASVTNTAGTADISVTDNSGLVHYYIQFSPLAQEAQTAWPGGLSTSFPRTGLTPNTAYSVQARLCEQPASTEYCSGALPLSPATFATNPFAPTAGSVAASGPTSLLANWTDGSANPMGSIYEVQYCTNAGFTQNCTSMTTAKVAGSAQSLTLNNSVNPSTTYFARVRTQNVLRPTWPDSAWFNLGSATTPDFSISFTQAAAFVPNGNGDGIGGAVTALAAKNGSDAGLTYSYSIQAVGAGTGTFSPASIAGNGQPTPKSTTVTFTRVDVYTITVTARDGLGSFATSSVQVTVNPVLTSVTVSPSAATVKLYTDLQFNASARDQFGVTISGLTNGDFTWGVSGGGSLNSGGLFSASIQGANFTLTATRLGLTGNANVTVSNLSVAGAFAYPVPLKIGQQAPQINFRDIGQDAIIRIFTIAGREIFRHHAIATDPYAWNVQNDAGDLVGSGVYLYRVESADGSHKEGKLIILK